MWMHSMTLCSSDLGRAQRHCIATTAKKGNFLSIIEDIQGILYQSTVLLEDQYLAQNYRNNMTLLTFNAFKYSIDVQNVQQIMQNVIVLLAGTVRLPVGIEYKGHVNWTCTGPFHVTQR